jgi:hypothetical protein
MVTFKTHKTLKQNSNFLQHSLLLSSSNTRLALYEEMYGHFKFQIVFAFDELSVSVIVQ